MSKAVDYSYLVGLRFGKLVVLSYTNELIKGRKVVECICDCGKITKVRVDSVQIAKSCGCYYDPTKIFKFIPRKGVANNKYVDGRTKEKLYNVWNSIKTRINNIKSKAYPIYGGRGIKLCKEWYDYSVFRKWAYDNGYNDKLTIERIDNDGDYCPENCTWVTMYDQCQNRSNTVLIYYLDKWQTIRKWCEELSLNYKKEIYKIYKHREKTGEYKLSVQ